MNRYLHTVWCDDIRQEVGNKPSMMGIYTGSIVLPQLPLVLQRLSIFNWVNTPIDKPIREPVKICAKLDNGTVLFQMEIAPPSNLEATVVPDATGFQVAIGFGIGPIQLPAGCAYLVVEAEVDGETLIGPKLRVKVDKGFVDQMMPQSIIEVAAQVTSTNVSPAPHPGD